MSRITFRMAPNSRAFMLDAVRQLPDGDYVVLADWRSIAKFLKNLTLPVIHRSALFTA